MRRLVLTCLAGALCASAWLLYEFWPKRYQKTVTPIAGFAAPFVFGRFSIPEDNPLSQESFELGRHLFFDKRLSGNNEVACASCHVPSLAFTDGQAQSIDLAGNPLEFSAMSLSNLLWGQERFFWDGRAESLEQLALEPIQDPREMNQDLDSLISELGEIELYRELFGRAYGEISQENLAKGLATFMRLLISDSSKYDQYLRGNARLTEQEELGRKLFMAHPDVKVSQRGGNCIDCHSQFLTSGFRDNFDGFSNNGLDTDADLKPGLQATTGNPAHRGMFKVPTLRNIAVTAPYMHDGRLKTLEEVMDHYNSGIKISATLSPLILEADNEKIDPTRATGLQLSAPEVQAIIAFLHTLTDQKFLDNPSFTNPFGRSP